MITAVGFVTIHHLIPVTKRRKVIFFFPLVMRTLKISFLNNMKIHPTRPC